MTRILLLGAALLTSVMLFSATAGHAQRPAYYTAVATTAPTQSTLITHNTLWSCGGDTCVAQKAPDRATIMCELVAKNVGTLASFTAGGSALDADALAKCNAKAK